MIMVTTGIKISDDQYHTKGISYASLTGDMLTPQTPVTTLKKKICKFTQERGVQKINPCK